MSMYATAISHAIGRTDPATVAVVESVMRDGRTGLDGLYADEFARKSWEKVHLLHQGGGLTDWCAAFHLAVPEL
ncbi:hypothetical protein C1I98_13380 [Spongiactinospora gelatinilytica]|uniref:Uncharacterized protein n=1 Tax=Spongiactinospora gelatinilytica TaxID=2666298 RepID=A0A2W2HNH3_9ACTN|nr:hypothetical protein [Spongiactinospora gelatinilytica]PZG47457.1 hypothetical protein C1I98_13380 [Spongiactinospora gelatinilytica]